MYDVTAPLPNKCSYQIKHVGGRSRLQQFL
jgi:hypothetical protein